MKRFATLLLTVIAALAFFPDAALTADKPQPELKLENITVTAFDKLDVAKIAEKYGISETLSQDGKTLLAVDVTVLPLWTDEIDKAKVDHKDLKLKLADGEEVTMIGHFERFGQFRVDTDGFYAYRPSNWKEKTKKYKHNAVFAVPAGTMEAELVFGKTTAKIKAPADINPSPDPSSTLKVDIAGAAIIDQVKSTRRVGDMKPKPVTVITSQYGKILEVKIKVTPTMGNGDNPDHFFWYTPWFAVLTDSGRFSPTFGELFMEKINNSVSHNLSRSSDGQFSTGNATLYFIVPKDTKKFKLLYITKPVAEGSV